MNEKLSNTLWALTIVPLTVLCIYTGGASSPFNLAIFPLLTLLANRLTPRTILLTGAGFSSGYAMIYFMNRSVSSKSLTQAAAELVSIILAALCAALVSKNVWSDRKRFRLAEATFQGMSNELSHRSMNLQSALDTLTLTHSKLQQLDRNKTTFLANTAHELRTPLTGIRSYSEILLTYDDLDNDTHREFLEIILSESVRLNNFVNDLLNLIRIDTGKVELAICRVNAAELIAECIKIIKPTAEAKGLKLTFSPPAVEIAINADPGQITQVVINLLNNAIKFTHQGGITLGVQSLGEFAEFFVTDSGEGIFSAEQEKIFDEFYRVLDSVPNRPAGSGLGLAISRKIIESHGGTIKVESSIGEGSTFSFTIPLFSRDDRIPPPEAAQRPRAKPEEFRPILVVMRNTVKRMCLRKGLESVGYKTFGAVSFEKALELVKSSPVDLIISEITDAPEGLESLVEAAAREGTPFYMANFHAEPPEIVSMATNGYIWKPFDRYQLFQSLPPLKLEWKKIAIISPDMEESRMLQLIFGIDNYTTALIHNDDRLVRSCSDFHPDAIIIGIHGEQPLDSLVRRIKMTRQLAAVPLILVLQEQPHRHIKLVPTSLQDDKPLLFGLSPLIQEIESEFYK